MPWYLASLADGGTHRGELRRDGTVTAACGAVFTPKDLFRHPKAPALPGEPPDLVQACLRCRGVIR